MIGLCYLEGLKHTVIALKSNMVKTLLFYSSLPCVMTPANVYEYRKKNKQTGNKLAAGCQLF